MSRLYRAHWHLQDPSRAATISPSGKQPLYPAFDFAKPLNRKEKRRDGLTFTQSVSFTATNGGTAIITRE
jgi:hypothetical protein